MRGQQMIGCFREKIERDAARVIGTQIELRLDQLAAGQVGQLGVLALVIIHLNLGQPHETRAKRALRPPRPPRDSAQLPQVTREKTHDQIRFPKGIGAQNQRLADVRGHRFSAKD
jgi:hypothetical protein